MIFKNKKLQELENKFFKKFGIWALIIALVVIFEGLSFSQFVINNITWGETTCTMTEKKPFHTKNNNAYHVTCNNTRYKIDSERHYYFFSKGIAFNEAEKRYEQIEIGKTYHIKYKGLDKNIYELSES